MSSNCNLLDYSSGTFVILAFNSSYASIEQNRKKNVLDSSPLQTDFPQILSQFTCTLGNIMYSTSDTEDITGLSLYTYFIQYLLARLPVMQQH